MLGEIQSNQKYESLVSLLRAELSEGESMSFLEESWDEREEISYKRIFGDTGPGSFPLSTDI